MTKSFGKESLSQIHKEQNTETKIDKRILTQLIYTVRKLVLRDRNRVGIYNNWESTDYTDKDSSWDMSINSEGASSEFGKINLRVYNTYTRDHSEDPISPKDTQTIEIIYNQETVFEACANKATFIHFGGLTDDPNPDADLNNFRVLVYKEGAWLLPLIKIGLEKK